MIFSKLIGAEPNKNHCPLCHASAPPGEDGWKEHLMGKDGCRHNPRRPDVVAKQGGVTPIGSGRVGSSSRICHNPPLVSVGVDIVLDAAFAVFSFREGGSTCQGGRGAKSRKAGRPSLTLVQSVQSTTLTYDPRLMCQSIVEV